MMDGKYAAKSQQEKVKEITEQLHEGIKNMFSSEKYKDYLKAMSKFYDYSISNCCSVPPCACSCS